MEREDSRVRKYKAVIFDFDDTLFESHMAKWEQHKHVAKSYYDIDLTDDDIRQHWGKPIAELLGLLYRNSDTVEKMHEALLATKDQFPKKLFSKSKEIINTLRDANVLLGVVSATYREHLVDDFEKNEINCDDFFVMQGSDQIEFHKPDPRVFDSTLKLLADKGINKDEVLYVGDSVDDYKAATGAGIDFIGLTTGIYKKEDFEKLGAEIVLNNIGELLDYIEV